MTVSRHNLTDELLNSILYIGTDGLLYRKPVESSEFCKTTKWNELAEKGEPVTVDYLSLKIVGLCSFATTVVIDCMKFGCKKHRSSHKARARVGSEKNLDKARKAQKIQHVDNPHNLRNGGKRTQQIANLNHGVKKIVLANATAKKTTEKPTLAEVLVQARKAPNFREAYLTALKAGAYRV